MLNLIEGYDWRALGHNTPRALHILAEATEARVRRPRGLLRRSAPRQGAGGRALVEGVRRGAPRADPGRTGLGPTCRPRAIPTALRAVANGGHGVSGPVTLRPGASLDTSYVSVVDAEGNAFSATPSDPGVDSPVIPGRGMRGLAAGLAGLARAGTPERGGPGKRPRLTPAPAMVLRDGRAFMPFGTPGGDVQQQAMLQVLLNITAHGMAPQQAVEAPRVATRSFPIPSGRTRMRPACSRPSRD